MMNAEETQDTESPECWIERHGSYLFAYALNRTRRADVAEDLVQETFLAAWRGRERFAGRSSLRTWLIGILRRKLTDRLRRGARDLLATAETGADFAVDHLFDHRGRWRRPPGDWAAGGPELSAQRGEFWDVVSGCLGKLPDRMRRAFVFRHVADDEPGDVCRALGVTAGNLWVLLYRARLRLQQCLESRWFDPNEKV